MATSGQGIGYTGEDLLEEYISAHIGTESELLKDIYRETNLRLLNPRMASGHIQGRLLKMLVTMIKPQTVLDPCAWRRLTLLAFLCTGHLGSTRREDLTT